MRYNGSPLVYLRLASWILVNVAGQLLLKRASMAGGGHEAAFYLPFLSVWFVLGIVCLGLSSVLWVAVLKKLPLTLAHPFTGIVFILVPIGSHVLWGEPLPSMRVLGIFVVVAGLILVARGSRE